MNDAYKSSSKSTRDFLVRESVPKQSQKLSKDFKKRNQRVEKGRKSWSQ